jgi:putative SOS response-associated peptidase YedK
MCGKFTAMATWSQVVAYGNAFSTMRDGNEETVTFRVMANLPVIVWDKDSGARRVKAMRWGFPHPQDWRRPQPIHARAESIETTRAFAEAFHSGQRGIVLVKNFNEAPESGEQHTITPGDAQALGIAFVWRGFEVGAALPLLACVMVTVPANGLIARLPTDRMPAVLAPEDWAKWLGEAPATVDELKACLKTVEGVNWTMNREVRKEKARREKPVVSDPTGLG